MQWFALVKSKCLNDLIRKERGSSDQLFFFRKFAIEFTKSLFRRRDVLFHLRVYT